ncbi:cation transporter [bacterium]|nr:cation transporter [bacterium]
MKTLTRDQQIVRVSIYGIIVNVLLVIFKAAVGIFAGSISVILDAVNNSSDALSSVITIVGTKLALKRPDKEHPFGYGRIEYFASVIIVAIVLWAGVTSLQESVNRIMVSKPADYSVISLVVIAIGVVVKYFFGHYVKKQGEVLNSDSLTASGSDAISDSFLSLGTLVSALLSFVWHLDIEGWLGVLISVMIIRSAWEMLNETLDKLLGSRADSELLSKIKDKILTYKQVEGVYDLTLHNYGPNKIIATAHIQVPDRLTAQEIHHLTRHIESDVYAQSGIIMTLGIYASNNDGRSGELKKMVESALAGYPQIKQMHGFYVDEATKHVFFDLIFSFDEPDPGAKADEIISQLKSMRPEYEYDVILDTDYDIESVDEK